MPNINNEFFKGTHHTVWRKLIPEGLSEAEVDFLETLVDTGKSMKVLDLMCGYGRHSLLLGRRGHSVTALDNLDVYINEINSTAQTEGLAVQAQVADVATHPFNTGYHLAICMGNSFAFFDGPTAQQILQRIAAALHTGGKLVINTWMLAEIAIKYFKERDWFWADDYQYILENKFYLRPARIETAHTLIRPDGMAETQHGIDYMFTIAELEKMMNNAGLVLTDIYSTPRKRPFQFGDTRAYLVAEKI